MARRTPQQHLPELSAYLHGIGAYELLTGEEERDLARRAAAGCDAARRALVVSNLRLVVMVARRFRNRGLDMADLIAEGNIGLIRAVECFDPDMGCRFSTYAVWWIQQPIRRALERMRPVRLPSHMVARTAAWRRAQAALAETLGRQPLDVEIARALGLGLSLAHVVIAAVETADRRHVSLESFRDEQDAGLREILPDSLAAPPWEGADQATAHASVRALLDLLDPRSRRIVELRYGLDGAQPLTLVEVGKVVQLTRERVRQLERRALARLQAAAAAAARAFNG